MPEFQTPYLKPESQCNDSEKDHFIDTHRAYQDGLLEHVILYRAYEAGLFDTRSEVAERLQTVKDAFDQRGEAHETPLMMAEMIVSLTSQPSQLFPDVAKEVETEARAFPIDHLKAKIDPQQNERRFSHLSADAKADLRAVVESSTILRSLRYDAFHESVFLSTPSPSNPHTLEKRLEAWVEKGAEHDAQHKAGRSMGVAAAVVSGPEAVLGYAVSQLTERAAPKISPMLRKLERIVGRFCGKTPEETSAVMKEYDSSLEKTCNTTAGKGVLMLVSGAVVAGAFYAVDKTGVLNDAGRIGLDAAEAMLSLAPDVEWGNDSMAQETPEAVENVTGSRGLTGAKALVGTAISTLSGMFKDKFRFEAAASPFKRHPHHIPEQRLALDEAKMDEIAADNGTPDPPLGLSDWPSMETVAINPCVDFDGSESNQQARAPSEDAKAKPDRKAPEGDLPEHRQSNDAPSF